MPNEMKCLEFVCPYYQRTQDHAYEASYGCCLEDLFMDEDYHDLPEYCPFYDPYPEG